MRITVAEQPVGRLSDAWRLAVGTGRLDLALVQREIGFRHIRGHGLLSDGVGVHRTYEHQGQRRVRHAFGYLDQVVDAYLELRVRPFVELGFMPCGLAGGGEPVDGHTVRLSLPIADPAARTAFLLRSSVSDESGNAWRAWCELGRPPSPTARQLDVLRQAAEPARRHGSLPVLADRAELDLHLARHEVTLAEVSPVTDETPQRWDERRLLGGEPS
jgi:beta-xylosidase